MGCGGSKDSAVAPADAPAAKAKPIPAKKASSKNQENDFVPNSFERGTSFVVDMGAEEKPLAPKPARLRRLEEGNTGSPKITRADLEKKQALAEDRRLAALEDKKEFAQGDEKKRNEMESKSAQGKRSAKNAIVSKTKAAEENRAKELNAKKKKGQESSAKGKKARARRLDDALDAGNKIETGGELEYSDQEDGDEATF